MVVVVVVVDRRGMQRFKEGWDKVIKQGLIIFSFEFNLVLHLKASEMF